MFNQAYEFWINLMLHCGYSVFRRYLIMQFCHPGAECMERGTRNAQIFFPSLASPYETNSKKDCLCAFSRLSVCLSSHFFLSLLFTVSLLKWKI